MNKPRGMTGAKPKPIALRIVEGNPSRRPIPIVPTPPVLRPDMPRFLDRTGRDEWRRIVPELEALGLLARCDRAALAAYCASYARWAKAERALRRGGNDAEIIKSPNGAFIQSAWVGIANRALHMMHRYLTEFGLSPSARARLATPQPGAPNDPAEKYFA